MLKYTLKRLLALIPVIIGVTFLIYFIMSFSPGDPARMQLGNAATEESVAQLRQEMGLDKPVLVQYVRYMGGLLRGDFGTSYITGQPVMREISACFPYTVKLALLAMALAVLISVPIGILSAMKQNSLLDGLSMVFALLGISMPPFWLGLMMILLFSVTLGWLPSGGSVGWTSYIMPAITVAVAIDPSMMTAEYHNISCELRSDLTYGQSVVDYFDRSGKENKCWVVRSIDSAKYEAVMMDMAKYYESH